MKSSAFEKLKNPWILGIVGLATLSAIGTSTYVLIQTKSAPPPVTSQPAPPPQVAALGRLQPESEILKLAAPLDLDGDRVAELQVKEGDRVTKNQIIAVLDSRDRLADELQQAREQVNLAQAKLEQVRAGAKTGEINAQGSTIDRLKAQQVGDLEAQRQSLAKLEAQQKGDRQVQAATIAKLNAELNNARAEFQRYESLKSSGAISQSLLDTKRLAVETAQQQVNEAIAVGTRTNQTNDRLIQEARAVLNRTGETGETQVAEAEAKLNSVAEVRPVEIQVAQAELQNTIAAFKRAETLLEKSYIRAPIAGQVIKIHSRIGEKQSSKGIAELAQTDKMIAIAEVYQTEIEKIRPGQSVRITSQAFSGELQGTVSSIDRQVSQQKVFSNQPGENIDRRIVEVKIRIQDSDRLRISGLTNLQVQTIIQIPSSTPP
jgi:HlyD family secretion protein